MLRKIWKIIPSCFKTQIYHLKSYLAQGKIVYQAKSPYNFIQVIDKKQYRYLIFKDLSLPAYRQMPENVYQGFIIRSNPLSTRIAYADYYHLAWVFNPDIKKVLMIGLGAGVAPQLFLANYPDIKVTSVEIDPEVVRVAYDYFFLPRDPRHEIVVVDGRKYIENSNDSTDLLILDAFFASSIPHHLFTREFFQEVKSSLAASGVFVINFNGALTGSNSYLFKQLYKTLSLVFPTVHLFASKKTTPESMQNIIFFCMSSYFRYSKNELYSLAKELSKSNSFLSQLLNKVNHLYQDEIKVKDIPILTDDLRPAGGNISLYNSNSMNK